MAEPGRPTPPPGGCIAGFDAGQTHTLCRLVTATGGETLAEGEGPGVSHLAAVGGPERFAEALATSFARARHGIGDRLRLQAAGIGASGIEAGSPVQEEARRLAAAGLDLEPARVAVSGDERTALRGAFPQGAGIVVICGTGTIAVGRDGTGREHRCGGWGWLLDGAGSAMDIGRDGLALSLRMADGRLPDSPLRDALWRALELDPADPGAPQRIKALVVAPDFGAAGFARLAPVLERLAREGDAAAAAILQHNADALAAMAAGVAGTLQLERPPVCALGGAIEHLAELRRRFRRALAVALPEGRLVAPAGDACRGAVAMAADLLAGDGSSAATRCAGERGRHVD